MSWFQRDTGKLESQQDKLQEDKTDGRLDLQDQHVW